MEKKMETLGPFKGIYRAILGLYWGKIGGYIGIMEKKMETLGPFKGIYRAILGLYWGKIGGIGIMEKRPWKLLSYNIGVILG